MRTPPTHLLGLATALPPHRLAQDDVARVAADLYAGRVAGFERMASVFASSTVRERAACVPLDWFPRAGGWAEKNTIFRDSAVTLLADAATRALDEAGVRGADIGGIVCVTSTGISTPTLDALVMDRLGLNPRARRLPIFGLGCVGGVVGLSRAVALAESLPGRPVLVLCVELCTLAFRHADADKAAVIAAALFGDGAAALVLRSGGDGDAGPVLGQGGEHTWPDTLDVMGWRVEDDGLGVIFAGSIPTLVQDHLRDAAEAFMAEAGQRLDDLAGLICHPGGPKVLDAIAGALPEAPGGLETSRAVLRDHGNMSAVTVLFVLDRMRRDGTTGDHLMLALGPGFTAGFLPVGLG